MFRWKTRSMECRLSIGLSQVRRGFYSRAGVIDVQKEWVTINSTILSFLWFFEGCNGEDLTPHLITRFRFFSDADKKLYDQTFKKCDEDMDGYVNGTEIKGVFLQVCKSLSKSVKACAPSVFYLPFNRPSLQWGANKPQRSSDQHISASSERNLKIKKKNESAWRDKEFATKHIKIGQAVWPWDRF